MPTHWTSGTLIVYEPEAAAAEGLGVAYDLLDFEALINDGNASTAVRGAQQSMERKCPPGRTIEVRVSSRQTAYAKNGLLSPIRSTDIGSLTDRSPE